MKRMMTVLMLMATAVAGAGELKLARVFQDNMVLQSGKRAAVWGTADAGTEVKVTFAGQETRAKAGDDGRWLARFAKPFAVSRSGQDLRASGGGSEVVLKNILVGEVWILAGQSNMQWGVNGTDDAPAVRLRANYPMLRYMFNNCGAVSETEQAEVPEKAKWEICTTNNALLMSATGFYFGEKLMKDRNVPVGLVMTACGATQIQNWTPSERFEFDPVMLRYRREFEANRKKAEAKGEKLKHNQYFSNHFNAKIAPIADMAVRGVCWYQGETGGWCYDDNPDQPACFFAAHLSNMIEGWQNRFHDERLWFVVWELPSQRQKPGGAMGWPQMRMQLREGCARAKNAVPVCILDTGWEYDVHPHDKTLVGQRGAERAEREVYGDKSILPPVKIKEINFWNPKAATIVFDPKTPAYRRGEFPGIGFQVKVGGAWTNAVAKLHGSSKVTVEAVAGVTGRVDGVRYLWNGWDKPDAWLFNAQGYPLSSFKQERQNLDRETSDYRCEYSDWVLREPQRRGVMSPSRPMTEDDFKTLGEWGATLLRYQMNCPKDAIRSPMRYRKWLTGKLDHLESFILPRAKDIGMKVVIDMHSAPGGSVFQQGDTCHAMFWNREYLKEFIDSWKYIANRFKGRTDVIYGYDLVNEPFQRQRVPFDYYYCQEQAAMAVRAIDPETPIVFESDGNCSAPRFSILKPLKLKNIIYQVHMYNPMEMTHQQVFDRNQPRSRWPDAAKGWNRDYLEKCFAEVAAFEKRHGAKIFVGEFSAIGWAKGAENWIEDCAAVVNSHGWDWTYHAFREWSGWSVEHEAMDIHDCRPAADTPRKRVLLKAMKSGK